MKNSKLMLSMAALQVIVAAVAVFFTEGALGVLVFTASAITANIWMVSAFIVSAIEAQNNIKKEIK